MSGSQKTPVTIIGGYLGAGKTTLVNHLLRNAQGRRLAILVNEFGELPIDADLIEARDDDIISLSGGCVCCSYGNDLIMAMMDMARMEPRPDHIVLEASGVALPAAIASSLSLLNEYSIDGIVVLADAETVRERANDKYMGDTVTRQLSDADIVLMNKADLIPQSSINTVQEWLQQASENAPVLRTEHSCAPPMVVLQDFERQPQLEPEAQPHNAGHFKTSFFRPEPVADPALFARQLIAETPGLVRAKGFVKSSDNKLHTVHIVGQRCNVEVAPDGAEPGIVTISLPV